MKKKKKYRKINKRGKFLFTPVIIEAAKQGAKQLAKEAIKQGTTFAAKHLTKEALKQSAKKMIRVGIKEGIKKGVRLGPQKLSDYLSKTRRPHRPVTIKQKAEKLLKNNKPWVYSVSP